MRFEWDGYVYTYASLAALSLSNDIRVNCSEIHCSSFAIATMFPYQIYTYTCRDPTVIPNSILLLRALLTILVDHYTRRTPTSKFATEV